MEEKTTALGRRKVMLICKEDMLETALAAAATAILVSGAKVLLPSIVRLAAPSPLLFLSLHIIVASIVLTSAAGRSASDGDQKRRMQEECTAVLYSASARRVEEEAEAEEEAEEEEGGDQDREIDEKAEKFIAAFRRKLLSDAINCC